jgi:Spy/CpxP family protein refolding chaperone
MQYRTMLCTLIISILFSSAVLAQPRSGERGNREEMQIKRLKEKVGITDDQAAKIKEIMKKAREDARAGMENGDGDREARREAMKKQMEKSDAEIMKLLTKEQKVKYEELKKERQKEMEQRRRDRES